MNPQQIYEWKLLAVEQARHQQMVDDDFLEKFAELVIRECASVVFKNTGPKTALNVLEHFGLDE